MRKVLLAMIALAGLASFPAVGQTQRQYLNSQAQSDFYACGNGCITGPLVAQYEQLQNNSFGVLNDVNNWTGANNFIGTVNISGTMTLGSVSGSIVPSVDNTYSLGSPSYRPTLATGR